MNNLFSSIELSETVGVTETVDDDDSDLLGQLPSNTRETTDLEVCVHCCEGLEGGGVGRYEHA